MRSIRLLTPLLASTLLLGACLGSSDTTTGPSNSNDTGVVETTTFAPAFGIDLKATGWSHTANGIYYRTLIAPTDTTAHAVAAGQTVAVNYAGYLANGAQFDAGSFSFTLGDGSVITGFDQSVTGMKVGERRLVLIPAALGYGAKGNGPIPPNATLVFVVEVVSAT